MLITIFLLALVSILGLLRLLSFESFFLLLLSTSVLALPVGMALGTLGLVAYLITLLFLLVVTSRFFPREEQRFSAEQLVPLIVFAAAFVVFHEFCLMWPDFVSMGERLRDYAILSATLQNPLSPAEPWMVGEPLHYYLFWYRFGHFIATFGGLETWETYHVLVAFCFAFFAASLFRLFSNCFNFSRGTALVLTGLVVLGSNLRGVAFFLLRETSWWDPSRVIRGAINEFPAWSFLLGDLHPHYLNLGLIPFCLCLLFGFRRVAASPVRGILIGAGFFILVPLWISNSNAWEVPMWAAVLGSLLLVQVVYLITAPGRPGHVPRWGCALQTLLFEALPVSAGEKVWSRAMAFFSKLIAPWKRDDLKLLASGLAIEIWLALLFFWSLRSLPEAGHPLRWVSAPIPRTTLGEIMLHWGVVLVLIALSQLLLIKSREGKITWIAVLAVTSIANQAWPVLAVLLCFELGRLLLDALFEESPAPGWDMTHALGIAGLALIILPEFVFVDDPYGGDNERMNTIFKIYSSAWFMLHVYAFTLARAAWQRAFGASPPFILKIGALAMLCGFFFYTTTLRRSNNFSVEPVAQGLSVLNERFPGAAEAIQKLQKFPRGVVLEAQGPAYDNTSHVSTLSGRQSYLGWANHAGLLTKKYAEVQRREQVTREIYVEPDCERKRQKLYDEKIDYVVLGPLERQWESSINRDSFDCLTSIIASGQYEIFKK